MNRYNELNAENELEADTWNIVKWHLSNGVASELAEFPWICPWRDQRESRESTEAGG